MSNDTKHFLIDGINYYGKDDGHVDANEHGTHALVKHCCRDGLKITNFFEYHKCLICALPLVGRRITVVRFANPGEVYGNVYQALHTDCVRLIINFNLYKSI